MMIFQIIIILIVSSQFSVEAKSSDLIQKNIVNQLIRKYLIAQRTNQNIGNLIFI